MRFHPTHTATVLGERVVGENDLGTDLTESDAEVCTFPCRYDEVRPSFETSVTGERVTSQPEITAPAFGTGPDGDPVELLGIIDEGQDITLSDGGLGQVADGTRYRIESVDLRRGRNHVPEELLIEVSRHSNE